MCMSEIETHDNPFENHGKAVHHELGVPRGAAQPDGDIARADEVCLAPRGRETALPRNGLDTELEPFLVFLLLAKSCSAQLHLFYLLFHQTWFFFFPYHMEERNKCSPTARLADVNRLNA